MAACRVEFAASARRQFAKLSADARARLAPHIDRLAEDPRPPGAKRLVASEELYRSRVGPYRIVHAIQDETLVVLVVKVGHRGDAYRGT